MKAAGQEFIDLRWEHREGQVRVIFPDKHMMVLPIQQAIEACGAYQNQVAFQQQFDSLHDELADWIHQHRDKVEQAFLTNRDGGLLFVVVTKGVEYDPDLEGDLTELDLAIANDNDLELIRLHVQALPHISRDAQRSFLSKGTTIRYLIDGK